MTRRYIISKRLHSFKQHCERKGYDLLVDDYCFIDKTLDMLPKIDFKGLLERYLEKWFIGMVKAESRNSAQNQGRREANLWLLSVIEESKGKIENGDRGVNEYKVTN